MPSELTITSLAQAVAASDPPMTLTVALLAAVAALAAAVTFLFRHYTKKIDSYDEARKGLLEAIAQERMSWVAERARHESIRADLEQSREKFEAEVRAQYEERHRIVVERYAEAEGRTRREFTELMETVANQATETHQQYAEVFSKFLERYAGPRTRRRE